MKLYSGLRTERGCEVTVDGELLDLKLDVKNISPSGFEWGYQGDGPSQLAVAILCDYFDDTEPEKVLRIYREFRDKVFIDLKRDQWDLTTREIAEHLRDL